MGQDLQWLMDINIKGHDFINILMLGVIKFMRDNGCGWDLCWFQVLYKLVEIIGVIRVVVYRGGLVVILFKGIMGCQGQLEAILVMD